jgi:hypothetical protein
MGITVKEHPETELEYFELIEHLGGMQWSLNHNLADGRIEDPDGGVAKDIMTLQDLLNNLVQELSEKFGVIHPNDCPKRTMEEILKSVPVPPAPEGKIYYWDWYEKQKKVSYQNEYDNTICSACPYSEGVDRMMQLGQVPCGLFHGSLYHLSANYLCAIMEEEDMAFLVKMVEEHGATTAFTFGDKLLALMKASDPEAYAKLQAKTKEELSNNGDPGSRGNVRDKTFAQARELTENLAAQPN